VSDDLSGKYTRVYSYYRFSAAVQEQGDSLRRQSSNCLAFCDKHNLTLSKSTFQDLGLSAFKAKHLEEGGGLRTFIDTVKASDGGALFPRGKTLLIVDEFSRLSRIPPTKAFRLLSEITDLGVDVCTADTGEVFGEEPDLTQLLTSIIKMASAHEESDRKSKHLLAAWEGKREALIADPANAKKLTSRCPQWLKLDKDKNEFIPIPDRANTVKQIYSLYLSGLGSTAICQYLNKRKVDTFGDGKRKAKVWQDSAVGKILSSDYGRTAIGELQMYVKEGNKRVTEGEPIPNYYPAVISEADFYEAQLLRKQRNVYPGRKGKRLTNLFQGLVKCGHCFHSMYTVDKGKKSTGAVLVCGGAARGSGCKYTAYNLKMVEHAILTAIREIDYSVLLDKKQDSDTLRKMQIVAEGKLQQINKSINNAVDAIVEMGASQALKDKLKALEEKEKPEILDEIAEITNQINATEQKQVTQGNVWKMVNEVIGYGMDKGDTDEDVYIKRSKLAKFLKQKIDFIIFRTFQPTEGGSYDKGEIDSRIECKLINENLITIFGILEKNRGLVQLISMVNSKPDCETLTVTNRAGRDVQTSLQEFDLTNGSIVDQYTSITEAAKKKATDDPVFAGGIVKQFIFSHEKLHIGEKEE